MGSNDVALSQSTLNYLVLKALAMGADHGFGVARWVERITDDALSVEEGSLYPALHRLERQGLLESRWGTTELNRRAKFYRRGAEELAGVCGCDGEGGGIVGQELTRLVVRHLSVLCSNADGLR
jgi:hypothetical protein